MNVAKNNKLIFPFIVAFGLLYFVMGGAFSIASDRVFDVLAPTIPFEPDEIVIVDGVETEPFWDMLVDKFEPLENNLVRAVHIPLLAAMIALLFVARIPAVQNRLVLCLRISAFLAAISVLIIWRTDSVTLLIAGTALMTFFAAAALGFFLYQAAQRLSPGKTGIVIGCGFALQTVLNIAASPTYWQPPLAVLSTAMIAASVAVLFIPLEQKTGMPQTDNVKDNTLPLTAGFIAVLAAVMFLCGAIGDIMANHLFYFWEVYYLLPHLLLAAIIHATTIAVCILSGLLLDKYTKTSGFLVGLLFLGACQAFILFFESPWMGIPYSLFNTAGGKLSDIFIVALPVYIAAQGSLRIPPQAGIIIMSLFTIAVRFAFEVINPETYELGSTVFNTGLGIALLLTFGALALVFALFRMQDRHERKIALAAVKNGGDIGNVRVPVGVHIGAATPEPVGSGNSEIRQKLQSAAIQPLTPRELEVAELTVLGIKRKIIADTLFIQSSTVDSHRVSVYNKFGVRTRAELLKVLDG